MAHLRKRGNVWYGVIHISKGKYRWIRLSTDEREARRMLQQLESAPEMQPRSVSLLDYLREWLEIYCKPTLRPTTYDSYEMIVRYHIANDPIAKVPLDKLTGKDIQKYMARKLETNSSTTVHYHYRTLRRALTIAVRLGYLNHNPADAAIPPKKVHAEQPVWTVDEAVRFLTAIKDHPMFSFYLTALLTGMRRGELLGLTVSNVDLANMRLWVSQTVVYANNRVIVQPLTKTKAGRRVVAIGPALAAVLAEHIKQRKEQMRKNPNDQGFVWANRYGGPIDPHNITGKQFPSLCQRAGVPRIPFHSLRHTHITDLIAAGVPLKVASHRAGHSSVEVTSNIYARVLPDMQREAALVAERRLLGGLQAFATYLQGGAS